MGSLKFLWIILFVKKKARLSERLDESANTRPPLSCPLYRHRFLPFSRRYSDVARDSSCEPRGYARKWNDPDIFDTRNSVIFRIPSACDASDWLSSYRIHYSSSTCRTNCTQTFSRSNGSPSVIPRTGSLTHSPKLSLSYGESWYLKLKTTIKRTVRSTIPSRHRTREIRDGNFFLKFRTIID